VRRVDYVRGLDLHQRAGLDRLRVFVSVHHRLQFPVLQLLLLSAMWTVYQRLSPFLLAPTRHRLLRLGIISVDWQVCLTSPYTVYT